MDFSDYVLAPTGIDVSLVNQTLIPVVAIDVASSQATFFQVEGLIGTQNADTLTGDDTGNWIFGGSGDDRITGAGGNDIIVGGSVRLDSLIGTYDSDYSAYDDIVGASHRATGSLGLNGLLDAAGMGDQKHFTEMPEIRSVPQLRAGRRRTVGDRHRRL